MAVTLDVPDVPDALDVPDTLDASHIPQGLAGHHPRRVRRVRRVVWGVLVHTPQAIFYSIMAGTWSGLRTFVI